MSNWELSVGEPEVRKKGHLSFSNKSSACALLPGMNLVLKCCRVVAMPF